MCISMNKKHLSLLLYIIINVLFIIKYVSRLSQFMALIVTVAYILLIVCFFYFAERKSSWFKFLSDKWLNIILAAVLTLLIFLQYQFDPYALKVDRWSAIHNFIQNLFNGIYPYAAQTHLGGYGSPFPIWQLFHIPFYLLGNVGLSFIVGTGLFIDSIRRLYNCCIAMFALALLILSPAYLYEVVVRSDLLTNFLLCAAIIMYLSYYKINFKQHWLLLAVIMGMMASTRLSAIIPFAVYYFYDYYKSSFYRQFVFPVVFLSVFIATFLPFFLWNGEMLLFFDYNPFILQSRQGNVADFIFFIPVGIWLSLRCKRKISNYMFNTACLLILLVVTTFVHNMFVNNNWNELFESSYDITYFNMALPFLIAVLINTCNNEKKHIGFVST